MENLKQDAPLPAIPLILPGFIIPPQPTLSHQIAPEYAPEGQTGPKFAPHRTE